MHEVLSYGDSGNGCFDRGTLKAFLSAWITILNIKGRIILRDFCKPLNSNLKYDKIVILFLTEKSKTYAKRFFADWSKARETQLNRNVLKHNFYQKDRLICDIDVCMELIISMKHPLADPNNYEKQHEGQIAE